MSLWLIATCWFGLLLTELNIFLEAFFKIFLMILLLWLEFILGIQEEIPFLGKLLVYMCGLGLKQSYFCILVSQQTTSHLEVGGAWLKH